MDHTFYCHTHNNNNFPEKTIDWTSQWWNCIVSYIVVGGPPILEAFNRRKKQRNKFLKFNQMSLYITIYSKWMPHFYPFGVHYCKWEWKFKLSVLNVAIESYIYCNLRNANKLSIVVVLFLSFFFYFFSIYKIQKKKYKKHSKIYLHIQFLMKVAQETICFYDKQQQQQQPRRWEEKINLILIISISLLHQCSLPPAVKPQCKTYVFRNFIQLK